MEFTAAHLCPNVHKKHSKTTEHLMKTKDQRQSSYMYFWAQKAAFVYIYSIVSIVTEPASSVINETKNHRMNPSTFTCSIKPGMKQGCLTNRAPQLCLWQPEGDNAHPYPCWDCCCQTVFAITLFTYQQTQTCVVTWIEESHSLLVLGKLSHYSDNRNHPKERSYLKWTDFFRVFNAVWGKWKKNKKLRNNSRCS